MGWGEVGHVGVKWGGVEWSGGGVSHTGKVGVGVGHVGVEWGGMVWVTQEWGGSCRGGVCHVGVG